MAANASVSLACVDPYQLRPFRKCYGKFLWPVWGVHDHAPTVERLSIHAEISLIRHPTALRDKTTLFGKSEML